tara:strand:- start:1999 stop:2622 length:624 start_codon:yes stop_codon:yes gene_type:complete
MLIGKKTQAGKRQVTWIQGALLLTLCTMMTACASSVSPPARYMLPSDSISSPATEPEGTLVVSDPRLAHYLDVDGIVMQLDDITLNAARKHQWAEGLDRQLARRMLANLSHALPTLRVMRAESEPADALTLRLTIDQFQGRFDGVAVASGQWQLVDSADELIVMENFHAETTLEADGYPALVRALSQSWDQAAEAIASEISQGNYFY